MASGRICLNPVAKFRRNAPPGMPRIVPVALTDAKPHGAIPGARQDVGNAVPARVPPTKGRAR